jgi:hypothetical protein
MNIKKINPYTSQFKPKLNTFLKGIVLRSTLVVMMVVFSFQVSWAKSYRIKSTIAFAEISETVLSGDTIIWENGLYSDINWNINKNGLVVLAEKPGMVIFGGSSTVRISADKVIFSGFQFKDGATKGNVIEISGSNVLVREVNIDKYDAHYYFHLTTNGTHNTVEHCNFENKPPAPKGKEGTSIFQVAVDSLHPGYHTIRYCSFKNHTAPENSGGDYGMEALRIGYSYQSRFVSRTIVEYCYFTRCNGDGEIISNKARENIFRYNTFTNNGESHLTLRHGRDNVVYGNFFLNGAGIRIKEGQNYMVYNNYFSTGSYFSIRLENYKVDPLANIVIVHNTFSRSGMIKLGGKGDFQPQRVQFGDNLILDSTVPIITDLTGSETFANNVVLEGMQLPSTTGFSTAPVKLKSNAGGYFQLVKHIPTTKESSGKLVIYDIPELNDDPQMLLDIMGNHRPDTASKKDQGCFQAEGKNPLGPYAGANNTGPTYMIIEKN